MFKATFFDYDGNKLCIMSMSRESFEDAERSAMRYATENLSEFDHFFVNRVIED